MTFSKPFSRCSVFLLSLLLSLTAVAQWTPSRSTSLVNDYSNILTSSEVAALEKRLVAFNDSTSNQITIVVTPSLYGDEIMAVAQRIGETWGVGQSKFSNGVVILVKSKTDDEPYGDVAIATGYGVEGALPDAFCKDIIEEYMVPSLGDGDYYEAFEAALSVIEPVLAGEYSYSQYQADSKRESVVGLGVFLLIMTILVLCCYFYNKRHPNSGSNGSSGGTTFFGGMPMGGFSSGRGGFSSGGFGGFGGGHFGGGGAHGRF